MEDVDNYGEIEDEGWKMMTTMEMGRAPMYKIMTTMMRERATMYEWIKNYRETEGKNIYDHVKYGDREGDNV